MSPLISALLLWAGAPAALVFFIVWPLVDALQGQQGESPHPRVQRGPVRGADGQMRLYRKPGLFEGWFWSAEEADRHARTAADELVEGPDEPSDTKREQPYR